MSWIESKIKARSRRISPLICNARSADYPSWSTAVSEFKAAWRDPKVVELIMKMADCVDLIPDLPASTDAKYSATKEVICRMQVDYARAMYILLFGSNLKIVNAIFDIEKLAPGAAFPYTVAVTSLRKVLARNKFLPFMKAVTAKFQERVDALQRYGKIEGLTPDLVKQNNENVLIFSTYRRLASDYTGSRSYIEGKCPKDKLDDMAYYESEIKSNASKLTQILSLNMSDIPFSRNPTLIVSFQLNPNEARVKDLKAELVGFKSDLLKILNSDVDSFNINEHLEK